MAEVEIGAVSKAFGKTQAVGDLSLTVADGEFVALLGASVSFAAIVASGTFSNS